MYIVHVCVCVCVCVCERERERERETYNLYNKIAHTLNISNLKFFLCLFGIQRLKKYIQVVSFSLGRGMWTSEGNKYPLLMPSRKHSLL